MRSVRAALFFVIASSFVCVGALADTPVLFVGDFETLFPAYGNPTIFIVTGKPVPPSDPAAIACALNFDSTIPVEEYAAYRVVVLRRNSANRSAQTEITVFSPTPLHPGTKINVLLTTPPAICDSDGDGDFEYVVGEGIAEER